MKAIILAAGYGRRMQPLSDECHKALLPVGGSTILGRTLDALSAIALSEVVIVTGYRAEDIRRFAAGYPQLPVTFVHNARYAETNNIVSLSLALDRTAFDEDVLLIECDLLFEPEILHRLAGDRTGNIALVDRYRPGMDGTVVAVDGDAITHVYPPQLQGPGFVYGDKFKTLNIYRFDREFCRSTLQPLLNCYANLIDGNCYYELVLGMLVNMQRHRVSPEVVQGTAWAEVDDPNDLAVARFSFEPVRRAEVLERAMGGFWNFDVLDFSYMRNAHFPTDGMLAALREALPQLVRNYGSAQAVLNEKMGYFLGCPPDHVEVLHGLSQVYPILRDLLAGRTMLMPSPSFGEYARMFPDATRYTDGPGGVDRDEIERFAPAHDVVVLVSPNSPTGSVLPTEWIHELAARTPETLFLVDESFVDFSTEEPLMRRLARAPLPNVVVLMSLSKSLGVPGLRLGYVYASSRMWLDPVAARLPIWNLGAPAECLLDLLLKYRSDLEASLARTRSDREAFARALEALPLVECVVSGGGNFLLVHLVSGDPRLAGAVRRELLASWRIEVKDVSARLGGPYLRVAVRKPEENEYFTTALAAVGAGIAQA